MALPAGRYGVTKEQLRKIKRLPINTIGMITETKEGIAMIEDGAKASQLITAGSQFWHNGNLYTATTTISQGDAIVVYPTENYNCKLSKSVTEQIADRMTYADNGVLGAKNLNSFPYFEASGTSSNGVTYTVSDDGSISCSNNTATGSSTFNMHSRTNDTNALYLNKGTYIISGCPDNDESNKYFIRINKTVSGSSTTLATDYGSGAKFEITEDHTQVGLFVRVESGKDASGLIFKPMIRLATDTDSTYQPYAETNRELTVNKADNSVIGNVEDGATASQAYAVGEHFQRNGKFCTCKANTAQGETWTLNTNYVEGALGDVVYIKVETSIQSVPANSKAWFYMDSLIPFANYEILNVSFMISGDGSGNFAVGSWIYTTEYNVAISVHNLDTADAHSWKVTAYLTLKI